MDLSWMHEDVSSVYWIGGVLLTILILLLAGTRRGVLLLPLALVIGVMVYAWKVERDNITAKESLRIAIDATAETIEANDIQQFLQRLDPSLNEARAQMQTFMRVGKFKMVRIDDYEATVNESVDPMTAHVDFKAVVEYESPSPDIGLQRVDRLVKLGLRRDPEGWIIVEAVDGGPTRPN